MSRLEDLLERASGASSSALLARDAANEDAREIIRLLSGKLIEALAGDTLRGLPNLLPEKEAAPIHGLRVNSSPSETGASAPLPKDGREVLVLMSNGQLRVVRRIQIGRAIDFETRRPFDEEIIADDLEPFVRAVARALSEHVARTERRAKSYERTSALASRLAFAVGPDLTIR